MELGISRGCTRILILETGIVIFDTLHSVQGDIKYGIGSDSTHRFLSLRAVARSLKRDGAPALIPERVW